jgi:hypothetical protein
MPDLGKLKAKDDGAEGVPKRGKVFTFQKECTDANLISTMGGTRRSCQDNVAPPSKKPCTQMVTMDTDNASNASSLTGNTKYTIQTKMSTMENTITDMQLSRHKSMVGRGMANMSS